MALAKLSTIVHFCIQEGGLIGGMLVDNKTSCGTVNRGEELCFSYDWSKVTCKKCLAGHKAQDSRKATANEKKLKELRKDLKEATKQLADYPKNPFYTANSEFETRYLRNLSHEIEVNTRKIAELEAETE